MEKCQKRVQNQTLCRGPFLELFWDQFGSILNHFGTHFAPKAIKIVPKSLLKRALDFHYVLEKPPEKLHTHTLGGSWGCSAPSKSNGF